jgi:hypothetical protein
MSHNQEPWLEGIGKVIKRWFRIQLDESSWLETAGPEEHWYCEQSRRFLFQCEVTNRDSVCIHLASKTFWQTENGAIPLSHEEMTNISSKLNRHFKEVWGNCCVIIK